MALRELDADWLKFVMESEALTGIIPFDKNRSSTKRHIEISLIVANASRYFDTRYINGMITGKPSEYNSLLRSGTEGALRTVIPDAIRMHALLEELVHDASAGFDIDPSLERTEAEHTVAQRAEALHKRLICLHPFKTGNGRTARLVCNQLRVLHGLKVHIFHNADAEGYYSGILRYREEVFLPSLAKAA